MYFQKKFHAFSHLTFRTVATVYLRNEAVYFFTGDEKYIRLVITSILYV
jgi:hypothetical protein